MIFVLYLDTLLIAVGFFMLVPMLGLHMMHDLGWSAAAAGSIMATSSFSQQAFKVLGGMIADRIGYKRSILIGVALRIPGYLLYAFADMPWAFAFAAFISGLAGAIFHPASYGAYSKLTPDESKSKIYAIREMLSNFGFILGPVIGMFLLKFSFTWVCLIAAFMFLLVFAISYRFLPPMKFEGDSVSFLSTVGLIRKDASFLLFCLCMMGVWALYVQLYLAIPVRAGMLFAETSSVAYLYLAGAVYMVAMQLPLTQFLQRRWPASQVLAIGSLMLGLGLFAIGAAFQWWTLLLAVLLFTTGQMVTMPIMNNMIASFTERNLFGTYFGFNGIALAIGGVIGNSGSGFLFDIAKKQPALYWLPWCVLLLCGATFAILLLRLGKRMAAPRQQRGEMIAAG
ncbi:MDR family MFS transporter [Paenibacillus gansuensis]|uniref:MDR family MFS transporter n=1 Tax=Paenibacillus gansuensis TaxID=306542 RepID=A0ABW5PLC7_9BACL